MVSIEDVKPIPEGSAAIVKHTGNPALYVEKAHEAAVSAGWKDYGGLALSGTLAIDGGRRVLTAETAGGKLVGAAELAGGAAGTAFSLNNIVEKNTGQNLGYWAQKIGQEGQRVMQVGG